jgi:hypothetical protein
VRSGAQRTMSGEIGDHDQIAREAAMASRIPPRQHGRQQYESLQRPPRQRRAKTTREGLRPVGLIGQREASCQRSSWRDSGPTIPCPVTLVAPHPTNLFYSCTQPTWCPALGATAPWAARISSAGDRAYEHD